MLDKDVEGDPEDSSEVRDACSQELFSTLKEAIQSQQSDLGAAQTGEEVPGPEIDPFWYVGRGVRPIGRFGKRQLRSSHKSLRPGISSLELTVDALQEQAALDAEDDGWW
ncbi:hypothetical protein UY3_14212 [Chelonia mydas]|uniref:Uncharacterized protein n=1 Tax=Chelonia mydas TaxID=8469 RepID=M7B945_CHEMY|nr:hypothetical protein UY3_14212 [Chelonia mydas]